MLVYSFAKNAVSNKGMYVLLNVQSSKLLRNEVHNGVGSNRWGIKYFEYKSYLNVIVVVPYLDKGHWSPYILKEEHTIHCDYILGFHVNQASKEFTHNVHIAWALSRGLNDGDANFDNVCECGYVHSHNICSKGLLGMWPPSCI